MRRADPQSVGVELAPVDGLRQRDLTDLEQSVGAVLRAGLRVGRVHRLDVGEDAVRCTAVEGGQHREDDFAVLYRGDVSGRERTAVTVTIYPEDHRAIGEPGPEEITVQRVGKPVLRHREPRSHEGLRRDLATEQ